VNLIHAEDLAAICLLALDKAKPGEAYNVSDGTPRTWNEIYATAQQQWGVATVAKKEDGSTGKRISSTKLQAALGYTLKHSDLFEALAMIESADRV
jgi:nucleoside-diphosphate-sugar epimerase